MMKRAPSAHVVVDEEGSHDAMPLSAHVLVEQPVSEAPSAPAGLWTLPGWLAGEDSGRATRISIANRADGRLVATALFTPAPDSTSFARAKLPRASLDRCFVVSDVAIDPKAGDVLPALVYACLRRGRIAERAVMVTMSAAGKGSPAESPSRFDLAPLEKIKPIEQGDDRWSPLAQRLDLAIHRAWTAASPDWQAFLHEQFVPEAVETLDRWIERFFKSPYFQSIYDGTMTKEQYIYGLSNMHQFVRWTTRLIGLAVSYSDDKRIRNKWLDHLTEEVNHELIIEKDLAALGADVDYVVHHMVPCVKVQEFMVAQQSAIAFERDPVLFAAAPFVAEGFCGRLEPRFIESLRRLAKSWGVENPKHATAFWASHIEYDGGEDGHYKSSENMIGLFLHTERDLGLFLNTLRLATSAFDRSYSSYIEDLAVFAAAPGA